MQVRMITIEPYRFIEGSAIDHNGMSLYVNMELPKDGQTLDKVYEDNAWCYRKPVTEIDFNKNDTPYFWNEESDTLAEKLLEIWNSNPHFEESEWKEVIE